MRIVFKLSFALLTLSMAGADDDFRLQPLPYNDPDLVVDLGVGLWAWPMPMDYDGDGDTDLLVACPDKPSRGIYFFENPSNETAFPVFKSGVRVGQAHQNMMVSYVDSEPIILRPRNEYRRDPKTGKFDFAKPRSISSTSKPKSHPQGRTRGNMWRYVDHDGDGDHDLVIGLGDWTDLGWDHAYDENGVWRNGPLHGYVYLMENRGTDQSPDFDMNGTKLTAAGKVIDVYGWPCPNFADFDGDGDLDLLCGEFMDGFTYFQNVGTRKLPSYAAGVRLQDSSGRTIAMHVQMVTPTAFDWDDDGHVDLVVGDEDGRVALVQHTGKFTEGIPQFRQPRYFQQQADTLKFGALATPYVYDWDDDGDEDILCGNTAGNLAWFENLGPRNIGAGNVGTGNIGTGKNQMPRWSPPQLLFVTDQDGRSEPFRVMAGENGSIQGPCEAKWGYTTFSVADWDGDGDGDIIYNSILSRLGLLINEGGTLREVDFHHGPAESPPAWYASVKPSTETLTQWRTTPVAIDFGGDDNLDLVMLDQEGYLTLRDRGGSAERIFVGVDGELLRLNAQTAGRSGRVKVAVVDWDGDGRLDVLTNSENAMWYRNVASIDGKIVLKRIGNLARRNVAGHTSSPAVCDFNADGKPDLLVGSENGRIYHIAHDDCVQFTEEQIAFNGFDSSASQTQDIVKQLLQKGALKMMQGSEASAPVFCETTRGKVAAWSSIKSDGSGKSAVWSAYHDGGNWSSPIAVASSAQREYGNPKLQVENDVVQLFYDEIKPEDAARKRIKTSYDRGRTFRDQRPAEPDELPLAETSD